MITKTSNVQISEEMFEREHSVSMEWDSYEAFLTDRAELVTSNRHKNIVDAVDEYGRGGTRWLGCDDGVEGVFNRISHGWPELREQLTQMLQGMELDLPVFPTHTTMRKRKMTRSDQGDSLDMTRVWNGQLESAWLRPKHVERVVPNTKRITLAFDITANGSVNNGMAMWRAALCMLLVDSLARAGRIMEVYILDSTSHMFKDYAAPRHLWTSWCVKKSNDPIVMDRLCAMVSVGFMRTAGFLAMACGPWTPSVGFGSALGRGLPKTLNDRRKDGEVVVRLSQCYSRAEVIAEYARAWKEVEAASTAQEAA